MSDFGIFGLVLFHEKQYALPQVSFGGDTYTFLNGIGYGIDGYCCEVGDAMRGKTKKLVNYAAIAVKGLLFHYKPTNAKITVDGKTHYFKKVWLAPTMNGRLYGGMIPTPAQDRLGEEGTVSTLVFYGSGKLKTLAVFPSIFKGEHIKHTEMTQVLTGHDTHGFSARVCDHAGSTRHGADADKKRFENQCAPRIVIS